MVKKDPLITYEKAFFGQAGLGNVSNSTFLERKIMSTKTSIKRIALVAAAALTLGGFSVITASTANAAITNTGNVLGVAVGVSVTTTAQATPGTTSAPVSATVVANRSVTVNVTADTASVSTETITFGTDSTFVLANDATSDTGTVVGAVRTAASDVATTGNASIAFNAPATAGTYYYIVKTATGTKGYIALTVVNALATTYDGTIAGLGSAAVNGVAGASNTITVTAVRNASAGKAGYITVSGAGATIASVGATASATGATTGVIAASGSGDTQAVVVNTPTAGAITVTYAPESAAGSGIAGAVTDTIVITVNATGSSGILSAANSTLYDTDTVGGTAIASLTTPTALATAGTARLSYTWTLKDALKSAYTLSSTTLGTVTISGPGLLAATNSSSAAAKALSISSGSTGNFYLFGDGTSGIATITFSVGATVVATKTVTFYSSTVAKLAATVNHGIVNAAAVTGFMADTGTAGTVSYVSVVASDASGNAIPSLTNLTATSSSTSIATVGTPTWDSTDLVYYVPVTGVASGAATITVKDSTATISATASIKVAKAVISTMTVAFGATSYNAGDAATLTITAKDSNGDAVADGYYNNALAAAASVSQALTSTLFGTQIHFVNGVATAKFFAPYNGGVLTANVYAGSSTTVLAAALQAEASAVAHTATATITAAGGDSSLAYDAASAATDAANNAYEEAQNATQAASDALAAVKALAVQVKALIALVNKIKAKLKA